MDVFEKYKNMLLAILITTAIVGVGTTGFMFYHNLNETIKDQATTIIKKDANITDITSRLVIEKANVSKLENSLDTQNETIKSQEANLTAKQEAYDKLINMTPEQRYGKTSDVTTVLKNPDNSDVDTLLNKISRMKYEDL